MVPRHKKNNNFQVQHYNQVEQVINKPSVYTGVNDITEQNAWIYDKRKNLIVNVKLNFNFAMMHLFEEVIANARDNEVEDKSQKNIYIKYNNKNGEISILNDGRGMSFDNINYINDEQENKIVRSPQAAFFMLGSSTHYDNELSITGGTHGIGVKLVSILSEYFSVIIKHKNKFYEQSCTFGLNDLSEAKISNNLELKGIMSRMKGFVNVTFNPRYEFFKLNPTRANSSKWMSTENIKKYESLIMSHLMGIAFIARSNIYFNGRKIVTSTSVDYMKMFTVNIEANDILVFVRKGNIPNGIYPLKIAIILADKHNKMLRKKTISSVDGIFTTEGGSHVSYIRGTINDYIFGKYTKTCPSISVNDIDKLYFMICSTTIPGAQYTSQIKVKMSGSRKKIKSIINLPMKLMQQINTKFNMKQILTELNTKKEAGKMRRIIKSAPSGKRIVIKGYKQAVIAGSKTSKLATLFIVEGESAASFPRNGIPSLGIPRSNYYGYYSIKGKLLNIRKVSANRRHKNVEYMNICKILGLNEEVSYTQKNDLNALNYGHLCILTDQDVDGYHIRGLIMNMFSDLWPALLVNGFLQIFTSPLIKYKSHVFYDEELFIKFKKRNHVIDSQVKYYKGLGSSTKAEIEEYFSNINVHIKNIVGDAKKSINAFAMVFSKNMTTDRKKWLRTSYDPSDVLDVSESVKAITPYNFINQQLKHYSVYSIKRTIPNIIDGFKPGQRKIFHVVYNLHDNKTKSIKVGNLASKVSEKTDYHHGEDSLAKAIVRMATISVIGINNISLLVPSGHFGDMENGTDGAASPRYIFTYMDKIAKRIFIEDDSLILDYGENPAIEPKYFLPIIPLVVINRIRGIGTGWSTDIPSFNPIEIIDYIINVFINKEDPLSQKISPWVRGFKGQILFDKVEKKWKSYGIFERMPNGEIHVMTPPIDVYTSQLYTLYRKLKEAGKIRSTYSLTNIKDDSSLYVRLLKPLSDKQIITLLGLKKNISTANMTVMNMDDTPGIYDIYSLVNKWCELRFPYYIKRKEAVLKNMANRLSKLEEKHRFIKSVVNKTIIIMSIPKKTIVTKLQQMKFKKKDGTYDYLLSIPISKLTKDEIDKHEREIRQLKKEMNLYNKNTYEMLWENELTKLRADLVKLYD